MEVAALLIWAACLITYLASQPQKLLKKPIVKTVAWPIFAILVTLGCYMFSRHYLPTASIMLTVSLGMLMWGVLVLALGHLKIKLMPVSLFGAFSMVSLMQMGGL